MANVKVQPDAGYGPSPGDAVWTESELARRKQVEDGLAVTANQMTDVALVAWAKERGLFVRICRPGVWGNPFVLGADGDRDVVIESYRLFIARKHGLLRKLGELRGKVLGCYCYPEPCHGDILAGMAQDAKGAHEHDAP